MIQGEKNRTSKGTSVAKGSKSRSLTHDTSRMMQCATEPYRILRCMSVGYSKYLGSKWEEFYSESESKETHWEKVYKNTINT